ncbi:phage protein NinX family protein [Ralstonia pseudosolanacearum]|uniref:DUF2591 domain-containing protein n=1 Tax=Ralstonia solanacearum TaxID=305 RepID=A0A0S4TXP8_RALSL|nr:hypothetical protein RSP799_07155 [Ralstonia solanacearum]CUV14647.1 conserved protein of unknown function [Ralstonia solanacearum]
MTLEQVIKTSDLIGPALDWAVAKCEGMDPSEGGTYDPINNFFAWRSISRKADFSRNWTLAGPIIERERINLVAVDESVGQVEWAAEQGSTTFSASSYSYDSEPVITFAEISVVLGPTPLVAAMRCYVASKLGEAVAVPAKLMGA